VGYEDDLMCIMLVDGTCDRLDMAFPVGRTLVLSRPNSRNVRWTVAGSQRVGNESPRIWTHEWAVYEYE
jgi:hypothetical protein